MNFWLEGNVDLLIHWFITKSNSQEISKIIFNKKLEKLEGILTFSSTPSMQTTFVFCIILFPS